MYILSAIEAKRWDLSDFQFLISIIIFLEFMILGLNVVVRSHETRVGQRQLPKTIWSRLNVYNIDKLVVKMTVSSFEIL